CATIHTSNWLDVW
nr:immunoglobulin heavy chain junction region [Macaca mulatta]